jgi:hypothetical protein
VEVSQDAGKQRDTVPKGEKADIEDDIFEPVKKEDDPYQKRQVVISGDHVLRAKIQERGDGSAMVRLDERGIALGDVMREGGGREQHSADQDQGEQKCSGSVKK